MSNATTSHDPSFLGDLEREVLRIVWRRAPVTAEIVREALGRRLKESTIRTVLHRLEQKGYLRHSIDNRTFVYHAAKAPRHVAAIAVKRIMDWLCDGSMEELLVGMVDIDVINHVQLQELSNKVARAKKRGEVMLSILFESALRSIGIGVVVWMVLRTMRIRSPQIQSMIWTAVLLSAFTMPLLMPVMEAIMVSAPSAAVSWIPAASSTPLFLQSASSSDAAQASTPIDGPALMAIVYALVAGVLFFRLVVGALRGHWLRRHAVRLNEAWASGWDVRSSTLLTVPVTYGRTIVLPAHWPEWSVDKRSAILVHEKAHVSRLDFYVQLLAAVHRAVFWFSPLAWWLQDELLKVSERACDDEAIRRVEDRVSYAEILVDLSRTRSKDSIMGVFMARGKTVQSRIERILLETRIAPQVSFLRRALIIGGLLPLVGLAAGSWLVEAEIEGAPVPTTAASTQDVTGVLARWIEDVVPYIATAEEQVAFKGLRTDAEREPFIEQFWLRRDPTPGTSQNEFRDEYFRRIAMANQRFTWTNVPGWKTDRGQVLIRFGQPDEVETHAQGGATFLRNDGVRTTTFPFEKWRYRFLEGIGERVVLEFVDVESKGDYRLTFDPSEKDRIIKTNP